MNMKWITIAFLILAVTLFVGCESTISEPNQTLNYNGSAVEQIQAPFILNGSGTESSGRVQLDDIIPEGTVYGNLQYPGNVFMAAGSETLPAGSWVDNMNGMPVSIHLNSMGTILFAESAFVTIVDPVDVIYLDTNWEWRLLEGTESVQVNAVLTGAMGFCSITSDVSFGIGGEGTDNAILSHFGIGGEGSDNFGIGGEGQDNSLLSHFGIGGEGSDNTPLIYNGIVVTTAPAPFLMNFGLARGEEPGTEVLSPLPEGTVYGHEEDPDTVYLAAGGEELPTGAWIDNTNTTVYTTEIFSETVVLFEGVAEVNIINPENTQYKDAAGNWLPVTANGTVFAVKIATGVLGGCFVETSVKFGIGGEGDFD